MVEQQILTKVEEALKKDSINLDYVIDKLSVLNVLLTTEPERVLTLVSKHAIKRIFDTTPYLVSEEILSAEMRKRVLQIVEMANESL